MHKNVINKTPKTDWKPGDTCYLYVPWCESIGEAKVESVCAADQTVALSSPAIGDHPSIPFYDLFTTAKTATAALSKANNALRKEYEASITSVPKLLQFALDEKVSISETEEYTDGQARAAFISRAKDLLGIRLKD